MRETLLHPHPSSAFSGRTLRTTYRHDAQSSTLTITPHASTPITLPTHVPILPPLLIDPGSGTILLFLATATAISRVSITLGDPSSASPPATVPLPNPATAFIALGTDIVLGFPNGAVTRLAFTGPLAGVLDTFATTLPLDPPPVPLDADNTSVVSASTRGNAPPSSAAAADDDGDDMSTTSAASAPPQPPPVTPRTPASAFMSRLFGRGNAAAASAVPPAPPGGASTPSAAPAPAPRAAARNSLTPRTSLASRPASVLRHSRPAEAAFGGGGGGGDGDPVVALAVVRLGARSVVALHASGAIVAYACSSEGDYCLAGRSQIDAPLVAGLAQFLLPVDEGSGRLLAVVTEDCEPLPHAVCVYQVRLVMAVTRRVTVDVRAEGRWEGMGDGIAGAVFAPYLALDAAPVMALFVATAAGHVAALEVGKSGVGMPQGSVWSAFDDLTRPEGLWHVFDSLSVPVGERLLAARRFSRVAISKTLFRAQEVVSGPEIRRIAGETVDKAVGVGGDEEEERRRAGDRVVTRVQRVAVVSDLPIVGLEFVVGLGVVVSRRSGVSVLRPLLRTEADLFRGVGGAGSYALTSSADCGSGGDVPQCFSVGLEMVADAVRALAVHAVPQLAAAEFALAPAESLRSTRAACILSIASKRAGCEDGEISVGELISSTGLLDEEVYAVTGFEASVSVLSEAFAPCGSTLTLLKAAGEHEALKIAIENCSDALPMASFFGQGFVDAARAASAGLKMDAESAGVFGVFTLAAREARKLAALDGDLTRAQRDDIECVVDFAGLWDEIGGNGRKDAGGGDVVMEGSKSFEPESNGPEKSPQLQHLDYWLLERALRLVERIGPTYANAQAAIALEALDVAPDFQQYEMMRAAAFGRFLDAQNLDNCLTVILKQPFQSGQGERCDFYWKVGKPEALRECIALLVGAAIDTDRFPWLMESDLSFSVEELVMLALERRARSSEMFLRDNLILEASECDISDDLQEEDTRKSKRIPSPYEYLYVWQLERGDPVGAAVCAIEWYERTATEGLRETKLFADSSRGSAKLRPLALLLTWARNKFRALSAACAAIRSLPENRQHVQRSRHSVLGSDDVAVSCVVGLDWLVQRLLLARSQMVFLSKALDGRGLAKRTGDEFESPDYIMAQADHLLGDTEPGVQFAVSSLLHGAVSQESLFMALDLALAWRKEKFGDLIITGVVSVAGVLSSSPTIMSGDPVVGLCYPDLIRLLERVTVCTASDAGSNGRNWYIVAAQGALEGTSGLAGIPEWLSNAAALGAGTGSEVRLFSSAKVGGDLAGMVRLWLRFERVIEAAQFLIVGLQEVVEMAESQSEKLSHVDIPYSCIDSTLALLEGSEGFDDDGSAEKEYCDKLAGLASDVAGLSGLR